MIIIEAKSLKEIKDLEKKKKIKPKIKQQYKLPGFERPIVYLGELNYKSRGGKN